MEEPISNSLRVTFLVHMILALVLGAALFLVPGRTLALVGWVPEKVEVQTQEAAVSVPGTTFVDRTLIRVLGAAVLTLGYASFLGWRANRREQVGQLVQIELVFSVLGLVAFLVGLFILRSWMPVVGWVMIVILAAFAVAWGLALRRQPDTLSK